MNSYKEYRFKDNEMEKMLFDKFNEMFDKSEEERLALSGVIFGYRNSSQSIPNQELSGREQDICASIIQWLGSHVGQTFLNSCGFELKNNQK